LAENQPFDPDTAGEVSRHTDQERAFMGRLLRSVHRAFATKIYQGLLEAGFSDLRPPHLVVFQYMRPGGRRATELAEEAQMTKQAMGYLITYLEQRSYVRRAPDPADGRASLITLSERGEQVERVAKQKAEEIEDAWAYLLGKDRLQELNRALSDLTAIVES
jgi:DNA-binding MarR family transcriptional regulator